MSRNLRVLGAAALMSCLFGSAAWAQSPITGITTKMTGVAGDLGQQQTGDPVQTKEKAVLRDLDDLIAALERQCAACRGGIKPNNPNRGMADSMISRGRGGLGPLANSAESNKDWAKLSPRERDRIMQSMSEGFPPEYRTVLERYYRRLAEEKTAPAAGKDAQLKESESKSDKP